MRNVDITIDTGKACKRRGNRYTIERNGFGIVAYGAISFDEFDAIGRILSKKAVICPGIAAALGATLAAAEPDKVDEWKAEIEKRATERARGDPEIEWITSCDPGMSSETIFSVLSSRPYDYRNAHTPSDNDDFGRCYRLLKRFPAWRPRLSEVAAHHPKWGPIVAAWDELTAMYGWASTKMAEVYTKKTDRKRLAERAANKLYPHPVHRYGQADEKNQHNQMVEKP